MQRAWHTTGFAAPLQERWDDAAAKMIALGQTPIHPITEPSVHRMLEWLRANQPKPEWSPPSDTQRLANEQLRQAVAVHDTLAKKIVDEQKILNRATIQQRAVALGLTIDDAMLAKPAMLHISPADFDGVQQTRHAASQINSWAFALQDTLSKIETVTRLENGFDLDHVTFSIGARIGALEDRISHLENELEQLKQQRGKHHGRK